MRAESSASQTAWALLGLLAAGDSGSPPVKRGLKWLIERQEPQGAWDEQLTTGTGFPNVFYLTYHLYRAGLPVPAPIAARYRRNGLFYTADLITQRLEGSESLAAKLARGPISLTQWIAIGRCIRRFHDAGVHHADLNAHNILLADEQVHLIDFDRCQLRKRA